MLARLHRHLDGYFAGALMNIPICLDKALAVIETPPYRILLKNLHAQ